MFSTPSFVLVSLASLAAAQKCALQFDGRIPQNFTVTQMDSSNAFFQSGNVLGQNLKFSTEVKLQTNLSSTSLFDATAGTIPLEVTISNASIFAPSATNVQTGFRRIDLLPASNNGTDPSTSGVKTLHFSMMKDATRPLNLSHEYQLVFLEDAKFSNNQFNVRTGTLLDINGTDKNAITVFGNSNDFKSPPAALFSTEFTEGVMHNFAMTLDFNKNTTQVFYSTSTSPLTKVTGVVPNQLGGQGQFHFSILKKPTNGGSDITKSGFQPAPINEGLIYGGIFMEDSSAGCVSLQPEAAAKKSGSKGK